MTPILEKANEDEIRRLQRQLRRLEFKISTQAYTPSIERKLVKKVKEVEERLMKYEPYIKAKKKERLVKKDIEELEKAIDEKEKLLKDVKARIKEKVSEKKRLKTMGSSDVTLADVAIIEREDK